MKLSTNLIQGKEKCLLEVPTGHGNDCEDSVKYRSEDNCNSENCTQFVKVIFCLIVAFMILFIGWTGWIYFTPKLSSSILRTEKSSDDSEFRRILYGLDRRIENEDSNGISAEDVPWSSVSGKAVTTSTKSVEDHQRNLVETETSTISSIEVDEVIASKSIWFEAVKDLKATINDQDKDESDSPRDTDRRHPATSIPLTTFSDFIRRSNRHSDYIQNSNTKDLSRRLLSHTRSDHQSTPAVSQSDNNWLSDDGTGHPAMKIKRSISSLFDDADLDREKCKKSLDPAHAMMDELAIAFLTSDDYNNTKIVEFREKFIRYLSGSFWYRELPRPDERQRLVKKSDLLLRSLLFLIINLVTGFGSDYNFVNCGLPTEKMAQQFRVIIETVVFGYEKCMWQQELARRATAGRRF